jgi:hypothetical protein
LWLIRFGLDPDRPSQNLSGTKSPPATQQRFYRALLMLPPTNMVYIPAAPVRFYRVSAP